MESTMTMTYNNLQPWSHQQQRIVIHSQNKSIFFEIEKKKMMIIEHSYCNSDGYANDNNFYKTHQKKNSNNKLYLVGTSGITSTCHDSFL